MNENTAWGRNALRWERLTIRVVGAAKTSYASSNSAEILPTPHSFEVEPNEDTLTAHLDGW